MNIRFPFFAHFIFFLLWAVLFGVVAPGGFAAETAGVMTLKRGIVKVRRQGKSTIFSEANRRIPIFVNDVLHTGEKSFAEIKLLEDKDSVGLYPNSHFVVNAVSREKSSVGLSIGKAVFGIFSRLRQNAFSVMTPTATIGVKGTDFVVGAREDQTFLMTINGTVGLVSAAFADVEVITQANQASSVRRNQPPSQPVQVSAKTKDNVLKGDSLGPMESIEYGDEPPDPADAIDAGEIIEQATESAGAAETSGGIIFGVDVDL